MGVWVSPSGYGFLRREAGHWIEMETKPFITTDWKQGTRALVGQEGRQQLGFDSTGLPTDPLTVTLTREGERVSVSVDMAGEGADCGWARDRLSPALKACRAGGGSAGGAGVVPFYDGGAAYGGGSGREAAGGD